MIKIKAMYEDENELKRAIINPLKPYIIKMKKQPAKGRFKRIYIDIENTADRSKLLKNASKY